MFSPFTVWNGVKSRKIKNIWPITLVAGVPWLTRALRYVGCFDGLQLSARDNHGTPTAGVIGHIVRVRIPFR